MPPDTSLGDAIIVFGFIGFVVSLPRIKEWKEHRRFRKRWIQVSGRKRNG